jgi:hypothetical protein
MMAAYEVFQCVQAMLTRAIPASMRINKVTTAPAANAAICSNMVISK